MIPLLVSLLLATLPGTYETRLSGMPIPALNGAWTLRLAGGGAYRIAHEGAPVVRGRWTVGGTTVTFADTGGPMACRGAVATGTYRWSFFASDGTTYLRLRAVHDACAGRRSVLTQPLARVHAP